MNSATVILGFVLTGLIDMTDSADCEYKYTSIKTSNASIPNHDNIINTPVQEELTEVVLPNLLSNYIKIIMRDSEYDRINENKKIYLQTKRSAITLPLEVYMGEPIFEEFTLNHQSTNDEDVSELEPELVRYLKSCRY